MTLPDCFKVSSSRAAEHWRTRPPFSMQVGELGHAISLVNFFFFSSFLDAAAFYTFFQLTCCQIFLSGWHMFLTSEIYPGIWPAMKMTSGILQDGLLTTTSGFLICSTNAIQPGVTVSIMCCVCYFCLLSLCSQMINSCEVLHENVWLLNITKKKTLVDIM